MSFETLGLKPELLRAVADKGYTVPTPIQAQAIPAVLAGGDVLAGAQTGTGKTAGFTLPLLQRLGARGGRNPRALVLTQRASSPRRSSRACRITASTWTCARSSFSAACPNVRRSTSCATAAT